MKILIIDDDEFLLPMYSAKFKEADFIVEGAKNGEEAIESYSRKYIIQGWLEV